MASSFPAERRLVTVLFADIVGHTEAATRLDPEDWQALLQAYFDEVSQPIRRYGGTLEKFIGDAIFAVFGAPRSHEDDAERAVRAAGEMIAALGRFNVAFERRLGTPLGMRIGIATGEAVAPAEMGEDRLVTGDLTSLAQRLQAHAPVNGVVLSARTARLLGPLVAADPLGPLTLKGFAEAEHPFVLRRLDIGTRRGRGTALATPLVGRERELAQLLAARDRLMAGQGQVLFVHGEAGVGKSRLIAEMRARLDSQVPVVEARCQEFTQTISYGVMLQHLRVYLGLAESDPREVVRLHLSAALHRMSPTPAPDVRPALEHLLWLDTAREFEDRTRGLEPEEVRHEMVRAITAFWEAAAASGPLVLVVEDLHWMDGASAGALRDILQLPDRVPLMLLCAFRPERGSLAWDLKVSAERDYPHRYLEIRLEPLTPPETEQLAVSLLDDLELPHGVGAQAARRAEGNPFYVEEVARAIRERGASAAAAQALPDTLHELLQARLDSLPPATRRVLQVASVIGRTFPLSLLQMVADVDLAGHLAVLQRAGFVQEQRRRPEAEFAFNHVLTREATYHALLRRERREIHRRVGEVLERDAPTWPTLGLLAYHFAQGEVWEKAYGQALRAADAARALSAGSDALDYYELALRIAADHPDAVSDPVTLVQAQMARGDILPLLGRHEDARSHFDDLLARPGGAKVRVQALRGRGRAHIFAGSLRQAEADLQEALGLLAQHANPEEEARAHLDLATVMERRRDFAGALTSAGRALAIAQAQNLQEDLSEIYGRLAGAHYFGGDVDAAVTYATEAVRLAEAAADRLATIKSHNNLASLLLFRGDVHRATAHTRQAVALAEELQLGLPLFVARSTEGQILLEQGRWEEARGILDSLQRLVDEFALGAGRQAQVDRDRAFSLLGEGAWSAAREGFEDARRWEEEAGSVRSLPAILRGLAEANLMGREYAAAQVHAAAVSPLERGGNPIETPGALRVLAAVAREEGHPNRALSLLEESRLLLQVRPASGEAARLHLEAARTFAALGQEEEARAAVQKSIVIWTALDAGALVEGAERLAAQL